MNPFSDDDPCPCRGGLNVAACTCKARSFVPLPVQTTRRAATGRRLAGCYAQSLANCGGKMSLEHAIGESIGEDFEREPILRILRDGSTRRIPWSSAGRRVLCREHNADLSALDVVGRSFIGAMTLQVQHFYENWSANSHHLFNGYDVERWMLKVLCGQSHNEPTSRSRNPAVWQVPEEWQRILFDGSPLPGGAGLYRPRTARGRFNRGILTSKIVAHAVPIRAGEIVPGLPTVTGIAFTIYEEDLDFYMVPPANQQDFWFRPKGMTMRSKSGGEAVIHLGWDESPPSFDHEYAHVDRVNVRDGLLR